MNLKETKQDARMRLNGKWPQALIITLIYLAITLAITYFSSYIISLATNAPIIKLLIYLVIMGITLPLSYGVTATFVDLSRDKKVGYTDLINKGILGFSKVWGVALRILVKLIIPLIICTIAVAIFLLVCINIFGITDQNQTTYQYILATTYIILMVILFIKFLPYALSFMILADNPDKSSKEIIEESIDLMKNRKLEYFTLCLSFFGWFLLIIVAAVLITLLTKVSLAVDIVGNIGTIILAPYILVSQIVYYENSISDGVIVKKENNDNKNSKE